DMVSPIVVGGEHLGNIYIGQFFYEEEHVDYELFRKQARQYGFDEKEYLAALDRVPRFKRETVDLAISFYAKLAGMISSLGYSKVKLYQDIARRKRAEKALQEKNNLLERVFDNSIDMIALTDLKGNFTLVGKSHEMMGYDSDYLVGKNVMGFVHPDDVDYVRKEFSYFLESGEDRMVEYRYKKNDGTYLWFETIGTILRDKKGHPEQILFNTRNITQFKQKEKQLKESEKKFRTFVENANDIIYQLNLEGVFTYLSGNWEDILGHQLKEVIGEKFDKFVHPDDIHRCRYFLNKILSTGEKQSGVEYRVKHKDGSWHWHNSNGSPIKNENGKIISYIGIARDITDRKIMLEELVSAKEKAQESDRLKSAFLANMSHEIRTPMNGILGFAGLLKNPELKGNKQREYIKIIEKSGARMLSILNDVIDISKIEAGLMNLDIVETNINEQIEYIYTFFKPEVETKGMKLLFKTPLSAREAIIKTDREKVYAILTNLVKNAIKYSEEGTIEIGYVSTGSTTAPVSESIELEFYVKDTGIGIPKEKQEAIFERFIQADIVDKMARQGAGLGLAITRAYVEMLGGKIRVESEEGIGSTFYFTLPYNADKIEKTVDQQFQPSDISTQEKKLKILIAEDDEVSEILLREELETVGKEFLTAGTGVDAVGFCRDNP
ncbi:MAG: PAS domain S-box protein, partial [Bacteroidales bacterium]|nr:PAS domain S-box protein [Bacteroidales bacterium]